MLIRYLWLFLRRRWQRRVASDETTTLRLRVWPQDLDFNLHMNNGRYFSVADIGRIDWWMRTGIWDQVRSRGWNPVAGDSNARFSRSLQPFQAFELRTSLLGWDEKWLYCQHEFIAEGRHEPKVFATVVVRYLFVARRGASRPTPAQVMALIGVETPSPSLPEWVQLWRTAQDRLAADRRAARTA